VARRWVDGSLSSPTGVRAVPDGGYVAFYRREYPGAVRQAGQLTGSGFSSEDIARDALMIVGDLLSSWTIPLPTFDA
jgi:hypothetical protein